LLIRGAILKVQERDVCMKVRVRLERYGNSNRIRDVVKIPVPPIQLLCLIENTKLRGSQAGNESPRMPREGLDYGSAGHPKLVYIAKVTMQKMLNIVES
jgi:hypothetical protein